MSDPNERTIFQKIFDSMMQVSDGVLSEVVPESEAAGEAPELPGYTLVRRLGSGGFGTVYLAHDEDLDRDVALKVLSPERSVDQQAREQFAIEARALARVRHNHVLTIYGIEEKAGVLALATEYIRGQDLDQILEERGHLSAAEAARIGIEMCQALAAVHAEGIIHRDVKTANILREEGGRFVLADFGLGAFVERGDSAEEPGIVLGSPLFMSPEQVAGKPLDARADLYSLGVVLYYLASGRFPCDADDVKSLFEKISEGAFVPLRDVRPDIPSDFAAAVARALSPSPGERYQSAGEMEAALLGTLHHGSGRPGATVAGRRILLGAAVLALLVSAWFLSSGFEGGARPESFTPPRVTFHRDDGETVRRLTDGDAVRTDDHVFLHFEGADDLHVYVLNEDAEGKRFLLFPFRGASTSNPLAGGRKHRLPDENHDWLADGRGEDWVCVLASREPLRELDEVLSRGAAGGPAEGIGIKYLEVDGASAARLARGLRSLGELAPARDSPRPLPATESTLRDVVARLTGSGAVSGRPIWAQSLELKNK